MDCTGEWKQLTIPEGQIAVLAGYTLERATCGLVTAAKHRMVYLQCQYTVAEMHPAATLQHRHSAARGIVLPLQLQYQAQMHTTCWIPLAWLLQHHHLINTRSLTLI